MEADNLCQCLAWDSEFFGCRVARITVNRLSKETMHRVLQWSNSRTIDCLYFLADADHQTTLRVAEANGFQLVDIRVTLEMKLEDIIAVRDSVSHGVIRLCRPDDIPALRDIARVSHRDSRFYYDSNFPASLSNRLYEIWIEKSCNGYADAVLVAVAHGRPVGYVSCHLLDQTKGKVGLVGMAADSQGKGLGRKLINESLRWFAKQGIKEITVVTQGRNCKAQRLYQRSGFVTKAVQLWYHRWFPPREPKSPNERLSHTFQQADPGW